MLFEFEHMKTDRGSVFNGYGAHAGYDEAADPEGAPANSAPKSVIASVAGIAH